MRKVAFGLIFLLVFVGGAWTALWYYAAHEAERQLDAWLKAEGSQRRIWTCPQRTTGGFPIAITISCQKPAYAGATPEQTVHAAAASLVAEAALTHPRRIDIALSAPFSYTTSDGQADVKANWSAFTLGIEDQAITLHAGDLSVDGTFGQSGKQAGNATALDASFSTSQEQEDPTLDFSIAVRGSAMPPLDELLGGKTPVDVDIAGRLDQAKTENARTPEEAIELWRQAGGRIDLASSKISRGESSVAGNGTLRLDDAHRLQGRIDASFIGLQPVLKRYGINGDLAAAGSLLNSLFGSRSQQPQQQGDPNALNLPINFQNGRLGVGPIRTPIVLSPLY